MSDDSKVMELIQNGRVQHLSVLFERYHLALYHYFLRMGNNSAQSEDLVQETFMKVMIYRNSYKGEASFRCWMYGIARNTAADQYRQTQRFPEPVDPSTIEQGSDSCLQEDMEKQQQQDMFGKALALLPTELREILVLHRYQQLQYEDIANLLNCNLNTLKARMRKAVSELHLNYCKLSGEVSG